MSNYTSIQAAYDAAKAAGAGATTYAKVLVCPGIYTEDVTMDRPGIDIVAVSPHQENELAGTQAGGTILRGQLVIDLSDTPGAGVLNRCQWIGIDIEPNSGTPAFPLFEFGGVTEQYATVSDCQISHTLSDTSVIVEASNSGTSELNLVRTNVYRNASPSVLGMTALAITGGTVVNVSECRIAAQPFGDAGFGEAVEIVAAGTLDAAESLFFGTVDCEGTAIFTRSTVGSTIIDTGAAGDVTMLKCIISRILSGNWVTGLGSFTYDDLTWTSISQSNSSIGPSVTTRQRGSIPQGQPYLSVPFGTPFTISGQTAILADDSGGAKTIGMPDSAAQLGPIRVKGTGGPGPLTVTPTGADTINGVAGPFSIPAAGVTLISNGAGDWGTFG
jgi:hypothetical protein